jgi:DNA-binding IclR family transcriptional regulator
MSKTTAYQIPVLQKAIRVLHAVADSTGEPTSAGLARTLRIAPATAYRIVQTFAQARWVNVREDGRCELGLGLLPITNGMQQHELLRQEVAHALEELTAATGITSKVSVRDGNEAVTWLRVNSPEPLALAVQAGARFHLAFGSSGAVFLSALADPEVETIIRGAPPECWKHQKPADVWRRVHEARRCGLAEDLGGFRPDMFGLSAPLLDGAGCVQGALTLTGLLHGHSDAKIESWRQLLVKKAAELNHHSKTPRVA